MARWRYRIEYPFSYQTKVKRPGNGKRFENDWLIITEDGLIILKQRLNPKTGELEPYMHDGATAVPDFYCSLKGAEVHDPIYQFAEEIAAVWECHVRQVLRFADKVFLERMRQHAGSWNIVPPIYFAGVTMLGYPFHNLAKLFK